MQRSNGRRKGASATALLATPKRLDNATHAYQVLHRQIVWGQLPPGARLTERVVAERLDVSRTPARSALHRLEQEGFLIGRGVGRKRRLIVSPLTMEDGEEVLQIVGHLEGLAARRAASLDKRRRDVIVARLRVLNERLARQARHHIDAARFFELDIEFHRSYVDGVAGRRLLALHRAIKPQSERYIRLYVTVLLDAISTSVREHGRIITAIARGDARGAQEAVETNWHNAACRLARVIERHGERGIWHLDDAD